MSAAGKPARSRGRRWAFPAGAALGWSLAKLAGVLLEGALDPLRYSFVPLSVLVGGLVALAGAQRNSGGSGQVGVCRRRTVVAGLALGAILFTGFYQRFARRVPYEARSRSAVFIVGTSRTGLCDCSLDDVQCIQAMQLDRARIAICWRNAWAVELALTLGYLLTLGSGGLAAGLLLTAHGPGAKPARSPGDPGEAPGYLDFDLWIDQKADGLYRAKAWSGAAGFEASGHFSLPASLVGGALRFAGGAAAARGGSGVATAGAAPEQIGGELFRTVFQGELLKAFQGCLAKAKEGPGLRLRLRLNDVPDLAGLPWEYLYDAEGRGFLALSGRTPVVRYLELSEELGTLLVEPPLRVLAVISTPRGYRELAEADAEWRQLGVALEPLRQSGLIVVERLERATPQALEARLRAGPPVHVFHFIGHGGFSELRGEGVLVFEDEEGGGLPVPAPSLAYLLQDHPSLRLAVLNACNGARTSRESPFAGTAQGLVQRGIPAVIAMQAEVMDETASSFAEKFYRGLAAGLPVDACIGEVRRAMAAEHNPEWGTPVLYLRATDGRLFALAGEAREPLNAASHPVI